MKKKENKEIDIYFERYGVLDDNSESNKGSIHNNEIIPTRSNMYFLVVITIRHLKYGYKMSTKNDLIKFFEREKYKCKSSGWDCPWYFIDIENKEFYEGRPGVGYGRVIGNHAVTVDEFFLIYNILNRYEINSCFSKEYDMKSSLWFCVKHNYVEDMDIYLNEEGFSSHLMSKSTLIEYNYSEWVNHRFISIVDKKFEPVLPGCIRNFRVIGLKVISFEEFKLIYRIFKKYENKDVLTMDDDTDFRYSK